MRAASSSRVCPCSIHQVTSSPARYVRIADNPQLDESGECLAQRGGAPLARLVMVLMNNSTAHTESAKPCGQILGPGQGATRIGRCNEAEPRQRTDIFFALCNVHLGVRVGH